MTRVNRIGAAAIAFAAFAAGGDARAQEPVRSKRRPDGAGYFQIDLQVLRSSVDVKEGSAARGTVWFELQPGKRVRGATALAVTDRGGRSVALPAIDVKIDADRDPAGSDEEALTGEPGAALLHRALASSDLALLPLSALLPRAVDFDGKESTKEVAIPGSTVWTLGVELGLSRESGIPAQRTFTRSVRRFLPAAGAGPAAAGWTMVDYVFTSCDTDADLNLYARGLRMLVNPARDASGERPEAGVRLAILYEARQLEWLKDSPMIDEFAPLQERFLAGLESALFDDLEIQGVGDPFDSPAALALHLSGLLNEKSLARLLYIGDRRAVASIVPVLARRPVPFDPKTHLKLWSTSDDPAERLLLAAGAALGGAKNPRFAIEAQLAAHNDDPVVKKAAALLTDALE